MADVFQEVDDMMKQERLKKIWDEYGVWIIAFMVLTVVFTGAFSVYNSWNNAAQERQTAQLIAAMEADGFKDNVLSTSAEYRSDLRAVAIMTAAAQYADDGDFEKTIPLYEAVKNESGADPDIRDLATVLHAQAVLQTDSTQSEIDVLKSGLFTLIGKPSSPWKYHAHLQYGLIAADIEGDYETARQHMREILAAETVPATLQEKAGALDHVFSLKMTQTKTDDDQNGEG